MSNKFGKFGIEQLERVSLLQNFPETLMCMWNGKSWERYVAFSVSQTYLAMEKFILSISSNLCLSDILWRVLFLTKTHLRVPKQSVYKQSVYILWL